MSAAQPSLPGHRLAVAALLITSAAVGLGGCPGGDSSSGVTAAAGMGGQGASAAGFAGATGATGTGAGGAGGDSSVPPWDPVWHLTEPKQWPIVGPDGQPDCGPGCRIALNVPVTNPSYYGHTYATTMLGSETTRGISVAALGSLETRVLEMDLGAAKGPLQPYLSGDFISYLYLDDKRNDVMVMNWRTGETKLAYSHQRQDWDSVSLTALNSRYVFWNLLTRGIMSRNLETGEVKVLVPGSPSCIGLCATEQGLLCGGSRNIFIDHDTGEQEVLDYDGALQLLAFCSPDKKQFVWIDYRDPPGRDSTYDFYRNGGEVYMMDLETRTTRRLTFDSPGSPKAKDFAAIGGNLAVWNEPPPTGTQNPDTFQGVAAACSALATLDLTTGERCHLISDTPRVVGYKSVHGRHVYGGWFDRATAKTRLVDIDLDDPNLQWQCEMTPLQ